MVDIAQSVGQGGDNKPADVKLVQTGLNGIAGLLGTAPLPVDGVCTPAMVDMIKTFQFRLVGVVKPDGRIDPGGKSWKKLATLAVAATPASVPSSVSAAVSDVARRSGKAWWDANQSRYPNSSSLDDLDPAFAARAKVFVAELRGAGATVTLSTTRRHATRAWLMHHCCLIADNPALAKTVGRRADCDIVWDHQDAAATKRGAQEMAARFGIVFPAALKSRHIDGKAIDMTISWPATLTIRDAQGAAVAIGAPRDGSNPKLHAVGKSYGVIKLVSDAPHWSSDGH
jgi:hypothetical protein